MASQLPDERDEARLVVGLIRGIQGLRGAVRVEVLTDNPSRFDVGSTVFAEGSRSPLTIISAHRDGPGLLVRFAEVRDRQAADAMRDAYLEAAPGAPLDEHAFYWHDIIGCTVSTTTGIELGQVADVFRVGESEVYVVRGQRGETLVPAVASIVKELVPADKRIVVDPDALGLTDDSASEASV